MEAGSSLENKEMALKTGIQLVKSGNNIYMYVYIYIYVCVCV